jgi:hypothetical protein
MKSVVENAASQCVKQKDIIRRGEYLWPVSITEIPVRTPGEEENSFRPIEYIPPEEIWGAMLLIVRQSIGVNSDALLIETARLFGYSRVAEKVRSHLEKALEQLLKKRGVVLNGESVTLPK